MSPAALDPVEFKKISSRNTLLPMILAVLLSATFIWLISNLITTTREVDHSNQVIAAAHSALQLTVDGETGLRGFIITQKSNFLEPYNTSVEKSGPLLEKMRQLVSDNPTQTDLVEKIIRQREVWANYATDLITKSRNYETMKDVVASERGKAIMDSIRGLYVRFIEVEEGLRDTRTKNAQDSTRTALTFIIIGSLLVGAFLAFYSRKQLNFVSGTYGDALTKQAEQNEVLQKQSWLRTAQGLLGERARGEQDVRTVCTEVLNLLCHYLEAKAGSFYIVEDSGDLSLSASYGLSDEDFRNRTFIRAGTTLASQVVQGKKSIVLDPAPVDHLKISSTLGSSVPTSIFIAPAIANGNVRGVMEFGFTRALEARDQELMEFLSENIGTAITSAQYRVRLRELLEESQRQGEELQTQQEELRVNNEELEEQAKALKESQTRLETQQAELEQTNSQLSAQAAALERQNDDLDKARTDLEEKAKELERSSQYKSQFLANMSHELRTPLNSTLILSQLLIDNQGGRLSKDEIEYARTILSSSNDLLTLINEILDLAKVESGTIELHNENLSTADLVKNLERNFRPMAEQKDLQFKTNVQKGAAEIHVDRQRLEQILKNLLSNAIKFTQKGSVTLEISSDHEGNETFFKVTDTGIGIPKGQHEVIFEAFQQGDGTTSRQYGGTGLGLTISRDLAKLLGGEIRVESQQGKGSFFTLAIPTDRRLMITPVSEEESRIAGRAALSPPKPSTASSKASRKATSFPDDRGHIDQTMRILMVVEDDKAFAKILFDLSHEQRFQTLVAQTAEEAIDLASEFLPHAIILDMQLPDHNGLFVLDHLKENPRTRHIPVHVISANDYSGPALNMGAIGYLMKPSERNQLVEVMEKLEAKFSQDFKKVLVVEDNKVQSDSIKKLISAPGVEVEVIETGAKALEVLQSQTIDCLILDLKLPDMTGFEVLKKMNSQDSFSHPPVIIYTARSLTREEESTLQQYSQTIILKGAKSPERLLSEVSLFLHQVESKMSPERQKVLQDLRDRERTLEGRTILIADDDVRNIFALSNALQARGAKVEIARNGKEAVAKVESTPGIELVLMDIMMPEMDGYEAMRRIREQSKFKKLPIIAITAKAMSDDQEKCIEAGASDYLAKPIDLAKLISLIKVWLRPMEKNQ